MLFGSLVLCLLATGVMVDDEVNLSRPSPPMMSGP